MELLRLATAGSVDDGKSTLIGRLLYEAKGIFADQLAAVTRATRKRTGGDDLDLSLLTDGLEAEREQGITIDVAYRYFATPKRKFIIADTPGHIQYTRNMVTGASTANLTMILVDARNGVIEQSRRHTFLSALLRVPHVVMLVNKMDLVDYSEEAYQKIADDFRAFAAKLDIPDLTIIPVSALKGDNVVSRSENMPWYEGSSLLHHLENIHIGSDLNLIDVRFPVQYVIRPQSDAYHDYRGYAGTVAGGTIKVGDEIMVQPSGLTSRVVGIDLYGQELQEAHPPMSVSIRLADDLDISRGDMLCRAHNHPHATQDLDAMIVWMQQGTRIQEGNRYIIKHTTRTAKTIVKDLQYRLDINDLHRDEKTTSLGLNEIGRVTLRITQPLFVDEYRRNRQTGSFILIDEASGATVAAGMVVDTDI